MPELQCARCSFACAVEGGHIDTFPRCSLGPLKKKGGKKNEVASPETSGGPLMVLLYYSYVPVLDVQEAVDWHKRLCLHLDIRGRIRVSPEGLNMLLDGEEEHLRCYCDAVRASGKFGKDLDFKLSSAGPKGERFPKLSAKAASHVVELGIEDASARPEQGGRHVSPEEWHALLSKVGDEDDDVVLFDVRNIYESRIGRFESENAKTLAPDFRHFAQFPSFVDEHLDEFKGKRVMMYCTGGVRCERASSYLEAKNVAKEVLQLQGGICRYLERYQDERGFFAGKNFVFDHRRYEPWHDDRVVGQCSDCGQPWDDYDNGPEVHCHICRVLLLLCDGCRARRLDEPAAQLLCQGDTCDGEEIRCGCGCNPSYSYGPVCRRTGHFTRQGPPHLEQRSARAADRTKAATELASSPLQPECKASPSEVRRLTLDPKACSTCWCGLASVVASVWPLPRRRDRAVAPVQTSQKSIVEAAGESDAQACLEVVNQAWEEQYGVIRYKTADRVLEAIATNRFLIVRDDQGNISGGAEYDPCSAGGTFRFGPLTVTPRLQGRGFGGALLAELESRGRSAGCVSSEVEVRRGGKQGRRVIEFYKRAGYQPHGPRHRNYVVLVKPL